MEKEDDTTGTMTPSQQHENEDDVENATNKCSHNKEPQKIPPIPQDLLELANNMAIHDDNACDNRNDSFPPQSRVYILVQKSQKETMQPAIVIQAKGYAYLVCLEQADVHEPFWIPKSLIRGPVVDDDIMEDEDDQDETNNNNNNTMSLNVAYQALEQMRKLNLELQCAEANIYPVDEHACTVCLLSGSHHASKFPRLQALHSRMQQQQVAPPKEESTSSFWKSASARNGNTKSSSSSSWWTQPKDDQQNTQEATTTKNKTFAFFSSFSKSQPKETNQKDAGEAKEDEDGVSTSGTTATEASTTTAQNHDEASFEEQGEEYATVVPPAMTAGDQEEATPADPSADPSTNTEVDAPVVETSPTTPTKKKQNNNNAVVLPRIQKLLQDRAKSKAQPCLICASPACPKHASTTFAKEGIVLCLACERLFELDFIVDSVSTSDPAKHLDDMMDKYDRCLLMLKYSAQFIEAIATSLEEQTTQQNKIGLGSSSVGLVSGVLGVAAAATIFTPAGPPLLMASLLFGGGATAVQTGSEARNYFSEPRKVADRILALHGMIYSLLRVTSTLRDAMLRNHIRTDAYLADEISKEGMTPEQVQEILEQHKTKVLATANVGRSVTLGTVAAVDVTALSEAGALAASARASTTLSRAGTAAARSLRFARFAGGALSAAVLVVEANAIQSTIRNIQAGNPCEKAQALRAILKELEEDKIPTTAQLDEECHAYLAAMVNTSKDATFAAPASSQNIPVATSVGIVDGPDVSSRPNQPQGQVLVPVAAALAESVHVVEEDHHQTSLLERIQLHRQRERDATAASDIPETEDGDGEVITTSELNLIT